MNLISFEFEIEGNKQHTQHTAYTITYFNVSISFLFSVPSVNLGVGKTSLVAKYISNIYCKEIGPTIGASFFTCKINLNNVKVKMQLWDTAGQERYVKRL